MALPHVHTGTKAFAQPVRKSEPLGLDPLWTPPSNGEIEIEAEIYDPRQITTMQHEESIADGR